MTIDKMLQNVIIGFVNGKIRQGDDVMKRLITFILALILLIGVLPADANASFYYAPMTTSQYMIDIIKDFESFEEFPYGDGVQWSIGYGTFCGKTKEEVPADYWNGISESLAEELLRQYLSNVAEVEVNSFFRSIGRQPTQQQFDAIVDFTYNLGGGWMEEDSAIKAYLIKYCGESGSELELVNALGIWCRIGSEVSENLCSRRIREALIYLHGEYYLPTGNVNSWLPVVGDCYLPRYKYVIFNGNGVSLSPKGYEQTIRYFLEGDSYGKLLTPDGEGSAFAGWYREDGTPLLAGDLVEEHLIVRADWIRMPFSNLCNSRWYTETVGALDGDSLSAGVNSVSLIPNREIARTMFRACFTAWQASLKLLSNRLSE